MIIIEDKSITNRIKIPVNQDKIGFLYTFKLRNTLTNKTYSFVLEDQSNEDTLNYSFDVDFNELADGEYEYSLIETTNESVAAGVLRIGKITHVTNTEYKQNNTYKQYEQ